MQTFDRKVSVLGFFGNEGGFFGKKKMLEDGMAAMPENGDRHFWTVLGRHSAGDNVENMKSCAGDGRSIVV